MSNPSRYTLEVGPEHFERIYGLFLELSEADPHGVGLASHYDEDVYTLTDKGRAAVR